MYTEMAQLWVSNQYLILQCCTCGNWSLIEAQNEEKIKNLCFWPMYVCVSRNVMLCRMMLFSLGPARIWDYSSFVLLVIEVENEENTKKKRKRE